MYTACEEHSGETQCGMGAEVRQGKGLIQGAACLAAYCTFPVVSMPRITHTYSTLQAHVRQSRIHHWMEPESLMEVEMLRVSRYQK